MFLDITTEYACNCAVCFPNNNNTAYITQTPGVIAEVSDEDFATEIWVKPTSAPSFAPVWGWFHPGVYNPGKDFWSLDLVNVGGQLYPRLIIGYTTAGSLLVAARGSVPVPLNEWVHIVVNKIGTDRTQWEFYVNGVRSFGIPSGAANYYYTNPGLSHTNHGFMFGRINLPAHSGHFSGCMAQARLYKRTIGMAEVKYNFQSGFYRPFNLQELLTWTPFNSITGNTTAAIDDNVQTAFLSNFSGNPWSDDCPPSAECARDPDCRLENPEDPLLLESCDQIDFPDINNITADCGNYRPKIQAAGGVKLYFPCERGDEVFADIASNSYINERELVFAFRIKDTTDNAFIQLAFFDCTADMVLEDSTIINLTGDYKEDINQIMSQIATFTGYRGYMVGDTMYIKAGGCRCDMSHVLIVRRLPVNDSGGVSLDPFTDINLNQYPVPYNCQEGICTSYFIINYHGLCVDRVMDPVCVEDIKYSVKLNCDIPVSEWCAYSGGRFGWGSLVAQGASFFSQPVEIGKHCDSMLIRYRNENTGWLVMRVNATMEKAGYNKRQEISMSSKGTTRKLLSVIDETYVISTDYYSKKWHDAFVLALESDYMEVVFEGEWVPIVAEETYKINWEEIPRPQKGKGEITVKRAKYKYFNTFC